MWNNVHVCSTIIRIKYEYRVGMKKYVGFVFVILISQERLVVRLHVHLRKVEPSELNCCCIPSCLCSISQGNFKDLNNNAHR